MGLEIAIASSDVKCNHCLSRKIVDAQGGKIWRKNNNSNNIRWVRVATFYISIPLSNEEQFH
jgi:hypothetical protein